MATARELQPGNRVRLTGTQTLFDVDPATGRLETFAAGSTLDVVSVGEDEDEPGACLLVFAIGGHEVRLTCRWDTDFELA